MKITRSTRSGWPTARIAAQRLPAEKATRLADRVAVASITAIVSAANSSAA